MVVVSARSSRGGRLTVRGVDTVAVVVSDAARAIAWYRDVLGLAVAYIGPPLPNPDPAVQGTPQHPGHWVEKGPPRPETRIHLCRMGGETEPGPTGITFLTDDIEAEVERLRKLGVRILSEPERMEWGEWLAMFADPDGNELDLKQPASPRP